MNNIDCPYCEAELEINHDDVSVYDQDVKHEIKCDKCEKRFVFTTSISFNYNAEKAVCLNDKECNFKLTHTHPKALSRMRCTMCGDEREMTENERKSFNIETIYEYVKGL